MPFVLDRQHGRVEMVDGWAARFEERGPDQEPGF
jgi:hypothetical protein